jgi:hypothetical protein
VQSLYALTSEGVLNGPSAGSMAQYAAVASRNKTASRNIQGAVDARNVDVYCSGEGGNVLHCNRRSAETCAVRFTDENTVVSSLMWTKKLLRSMCYDAREKDQFQEGFSVRATQ